MGVKKGDTIRILDTEFAKQIGLEVGSEHTVVDTPKSLTDTVTVRIEFDGSTPLLINDSLNTEFEVVN